jgi:uncharacterized DUF497 family protein
MTDTVDSTKVSFVLQSPLDSSIRFLVWDDFNLVHIGTHDVTQQEVEEALSGKVIVLPGHHNRLLVLGCTDQERLLTVVLDRLSDLVAYVVTARQMSKKEREFYSKTIGTTP